MLWFELSAFVPPADVEAVADLLRAAAPGGVVIDEPVDLLGPEQGFRVRRADPVAIRAYLPASELGAVLVEDLRRRVAAAFPALELIARPLYEEDWAVSWREFFGPVATGGTFVVVPSWADYRPGPGERLIRIDPGQAFGTGHHETTRLCLLAMEEHVRPGITVADVGTGSGILSIAAALFGAARVDAFDLDPVALEVAAANCGANGIAVPAQVAFHRGSLAGAPQPAPPAPAKPGDGDRGGEVPPAYGLVVANISRDANLGLAPAFATAIRPGGILVVSGFLATDTPLLVAALGEAGFTPTATRHERDWALLELRRR